MSSQVDAGDAVAGIRYKRGEEAVGAAAVSYAGGKHHQRPMPDHLVPNDLGSKEPGLWIIGRQEFDNAEPVLLVLSERSKSSLYFVPKTPRSPFSKVLLQLKATGIEGRVLKVGDSAPTFSLFNQDHMQVDSAFLLRQGPLVVSFFRGHW